MILFVQVLLPDNYNFLFHSAMQIGFTLYIYFVDHKTSNVLVNNTTDRPLCIPQRYKLGYLLDIANNNCFLVDTK